ncbi:MAG TPA: ABC transporter ATP-binding protein [Burkholderiales bacterium]|nr:ABC transporter ATP-binding protein [Burkholderiales bacterium]
MISIRGLSKLFPTQDGTLVALRDVNLDIQEGGFLSFVGPSGCGKSTLLNIIGGLLQRTEGEVRLRGEVQDRPRRELGMMFQAPVLFPWRTIVENVLLPVEVLGLDRAEYQRKAMEILNLVGLKGFERAYPRQLSGGMQQRAALSRVLVYDPDVLLLDEPFGSLDEFTREALNLELMNIWSATRKTILFVTHNIGEAVFLSDRIVVMTPRPGRIVKVVDVNLPRPRTRDIMHTPAYADRVFEVRELLGVAH